MTKPNDPVTGDFRSDEPRIRKTSLAARIWLFFFFVVVGYASAIAWDRAPEYRVAVVLAMASLFLYGPVADYLIKTGIRRGLRACSKKDYETAILEIERAYAFFERHSWIDRYRWIIALNITKASYREIALHNIASIHYRNGDWDDAKVVFHRMLALFPDNEVARLGLAKIETFD